MASRAATPSPGASPGRERTAAGAHPRLEQRDHLVARQLRGVHPLVARVPGQRRVRALAVATVARLELRAYRRLVGGAPRGAELVEAAGDAHLGARIEKELAGRVGEDHAADVASLHHRAACAAEGALQLDEA